MMQFIYKLGNHHNITNYTDQGIMCLDDSLNLMIFGEL